MTRKDEKRGRVKAHHWYRHGHQGELLDIMTEVALKKIQE